MSQTNAETKRPVKRSEVSKLRWTWEEMKNNKTAYFMLAPFFLLFIIVRSRRIARPEIPIREVHTILFGIGDDACRVGHGSVEVVSSRVLLCDIFLRI